MLSSSVSSALFCSAAPETGNQARPKGREREWAELGRGVQLKQRKPGNRESIPNMFLLPVYSFTEYLYLYYVYIYIYYIYRAPAMCRTDLSPEVKGTNKTDEVPGRGGLHWSSGRDKDQGA